MGRIGQGGEVPRRRAEEGCLTNRTPPLLLAGKFDASDQREGDVMTRNKKLATAFVCLFAALPWVAHAQTEIRSWHLLQKQYDGLIRSVQHGLTQHECEFARARVMGEPATDEEKATAKRIADERAARHQADEEKWLAEHPWCTGGNEDWRKDAPKECRAGLFGSVIFDSGSGRSINMTDIASAECFQ